MKKMVLIKNFVNDFYNHKNKPQKYIIKFYKNIIIKFKLNVKLLYAKNAKK